MCGTSVDAIDAVAAHWQHGRPHIVATHSQPLQAALQHDLLALTRAGRAQFDHLFALDAQVASAHAEAVAALLSTHTIAPTDVRAIGFHGQTVYHAPTADPPFTVQLGDPSRLAVATGVPVVADVRRADIALGGQGAPLAPALHAALFASDTAPRAVLNLGGIANLSLLPTDGAPITGFDTGPANALMDAWCAAHLGTAFDADGQLAASGATDATLLRQLRSHPFFAQSPPKSTGREQFHLGWLESAIGTRNLAHADVLATLVQLTATTVTDALAQALPNCVELLVCGGGRHNAALMARLRAHVDCAVVPTDSHGVDGDWVEALLMAWLARQRLAGVPANCPSVTGARAATPLGGLYLPPEAV